MDERTFGALIDGDVFIVLGQAWQKIAVCTAVNYENTEALATGPDMVVDFVGYGIWPSDERLKGVMSSAEM